MYKIKLKKLYINYKIRLIWSQVDFLKLKSNQLKYSQKKFDIKLSKIKVLVKKIDLTHL